MPHQGEKSFGKRGRRVRPILSWENRERLHKSIQERVSNGRSIHHLCTRAVRHKVPQAARLVRHSAEWRPAWAPGHSIAARTSAARTSLSSPVPEPESTKSDPPWTRSIEYVVPEDRQGGRVDGARLRAIILAGATVSVPRPAGEKPSAGSFLGFYDTSSRLSVGSLRQPSACSNVCVLRPAVACMRNVGVPPTSEVCQVDRAPKVTSVAAESG